MRKRGKKIFFNYDDTWDMSHTLSPVIANGLIKFKEVVLIGEDGTGHPFAGIPSSVSCEGSSINDIKSLNFDKDDDEAHQALWEEWKRRVDCMIYAFSAKEPDAPPVFEFKRESSEEGDPKSLRRFDIEITDQEAYDKYREDESLHHKKVQEGLEYFAKHFRDLWW